MADIFVPLLAGHTPSCLMSVRAVKSDTIDVVASGLTPWWGPVLLTMEYLCFLWSGK